MPKFIIHWRIFDHQGAGVVDVPEGAAVSAIAGASMTTQTIARRMSYAELMEVFESNSSHGAVPLTTETAREYGVPFEEDEGAPDAGHDEAPSGSSSTRGK